MVNTAFLLLIHGSGAIMTFGGTTDLSCMPGGRTIAMQFTHERQDCRYMAMNSGARNDGDQPEVDRVRTAIQ